MKRFYFILFFCCFLFQAFAQPKEITLVATGEGNTKEEAISNALRSAVEQAYGVYVSATTEILNDELIKDEVAAISSGNVKTFEEKAYIQTANGTSLVTLNVVVSLGQLVNYAKNHGAQTEFAGSSFGANMRLYESNKKSTQKALEHFYKELSELALTMYDYRLVVKDPVVKDGAGEVEMTVEVVANSNTKQIGEYFINKIEALSYPEQRILPLSEMGCAFYAYYTRIFGGKDISDRANCLVMTVAQKPHGAPRSAGYSFQKEDFIVPLRYLYAPIDKDCINEIFLSSAFNFDIIDNFNNSYSFSQPEPNYIVRPRVGDLLLYGSLRTTDNSYAQPFPTGFSGVYVHEGLSQRNSYLDFQKPVVEGSEVMGVVVSTTNYSPGDVIYTIKKSFSIDKETLFKITGFSISPIQH